MNPYVSITIRTFTMWLLSAVVNALLSGIYLGVIDVYHENVVLMIVAAGICSLLFAIPGFLIFWIVMMVVVSRKIYCRSLFRAALLAGIILSSVTAGFSVGFFNEAKELAVPFLIVLSAIISIMMHFNLLKTIGTGKTNSLNKFRLN